MKRLSDTWKDLLVLLAFLLAIWVAITTDWRTLPYTAVSFIVIIAASFLIPHLYEYIESMRSVTFYPNWLRVPKKYTAKKTLEFLQKNPTQVQIIARNALRWLCGDEKLFDSEDSEKQETYRKERQCLQTMIQNAVECGSSIHFLIQHPKINIPAFSNSERERLRRHTCAAVISYMEISEKLEKLNQDVGNRLTLTFTHQIVETSMVLMRKMGGTPVRLIWDLGMQFQGIRGSGSRISKPFLCFSKKGCRENIEYVKQFESRLTSLKSTTDLAIETKKGHDKIDELVHKYKKHSNLRNDKSDNLAKLAGRYFVAGLNSEVKPLPPVCIQLLVTKNCTTTCKMCDHYKIPTHDMEKQELLNTLACISDIGTTSVILSGGEPLAHEDIFTIINHAATLKLDIGLLTNGVMKDKAGVFFSVKGEHAAIIAEKCRWMQLSIDSFNTETYRTIRGGDHLNIALASLCNIYGAGLQHIEVCFTIQKDNVNELPELPEKIEKLLPGNIPLRLKLAHSSTPDDSFLAKYDNVLDALHKLQKISPNNPRINTDYLIDIMENYFDEEGVNKGIPLQNKMNQYNDYRYSCHLLHLTCMIDSDGKIYSCCFLYDDNCGQSNIRDHYCLGSLRPDQNKNQVPKPFNGNNVFSNVWYPNTSRLNFNPKHLPVNHIACAQCIRHFYQNEYLNELVKIFKNFPMTARKLANEDIAQSIWL